MNMTFFRRAIGDSHPALSGVSDLHGAQATSGVDLFGEIRDRAQSSQPLLIESRTQLERGWSVIPMPQIQSLSWLENAVLLERNTSTGLQKLMLIRQDRYATAAGMTFMREIQDRLLPDCLFCMASAAVIAELQQAQIAARAPHPAQQANVSNALQRSYEIIQLAIDVNASDIHVEFFKEGRFAPGVELKMRVNGTVRPVQASTDLAAIAALESMITALFQNPAIAPEPEKSHSTFNPLARCYAGLKPPVRGAELRFESNPTVAGYKVVMRLLSYDGKSTAGRRAPLDAGLATRFLGSERKADVVPCHQALGFSMLQELQLMRASLAPAGLLLVVGATGSGKTTTLAATLEADPFAHEKVRYGMEIPPEIGIVNLTQLKVNLSTLSEVAVGVARSDPDVIYAGEINNQETALMAQDYALTGHLTLATFHANSAGDALLRLIGERIQMDPAVLAMDRFLRAVLYQKLVGLLCPDCRVPAVRDLGPDRGELLQKKFALDVSKMFVRHRHGGDGKPCPRCGGTGEIGRTVVAELIVPDRRFLELLRNRAVYEAIDHYRSQRASAFDDPDTRGKTFVEHALAKAAQGLICTNEIFDSVEDLFTYDVHPISSRTVNHLLRRTSRRDEVQP